MPRNCEKNYLFQLPNKLDELMHLAGNIRQLEAYRQLSPQARYTLDLALEEMATNIIKYGYDNTEPRSIEIGIHFNPGEVILTLCDDGHEFNPLTVTPSSLESELAECPVGGLGIHLIKNMVRSMDYVRQNNRNILVIVIDR